MKKLLLSIGFIFAAQSLFSGENEAGQIRDALNFSVQAESISAGPLSEKNEKFIRDCMAEWRIENPTIQFRRPTQEVMDIYPVYKLHFYVKLYNYLYINEVVFDSLTDGEKRVMASIYLFEMSSSTFKKIAQAKPWISVGVQSVLATLIYFSLQSKDTLCSYQLTTFKRWAIIILGSELVTALLVDLPFYTYAKIFGKNEIFAIDQIRAERLNDYQSVIGFMKKLHKIIEQLVVEDKAYWQELYSQLPGRIENLEKLAAEKA